jgi:acetoacetyl-CoA reductase
MRTSRLAVVSGGIGGLGTAICLELAARGHRVIAADLERRPEALERFQRVTEGRGDIRHHPLDVTDFAQCQAQIDAWESQQGRIDILVHAAGITRDQTLRKMSPESWHAVIAVDLDSAFNLCRQLVPRMMQRGFGRIVNISSVNGQTGQFGQTNYAAAKAGLHGFTMSLARECARHGVTANCVAPGYIDTEMTRAIREDIRQQIVESIPVGRIGHPEDIARVVGFLCDEQSDFITGALIPVNGGQFMSF